ncbi:MAG: hypothetical protein JEZ04_12320 [Spirochaetales bacterium]|nr:hypothetical protein [Spirochaetales bacterium]
MFESSFECMDMYNAKKQDLNRFVEKSRRGRKDREDKIREGRKPGRLLSVALIIKNLIL